MSCLPLGRVGDNEKGNMWVILLVPMLQIWGSWVFREHKKVWALIDTTSPDWKVDQRANLALRSYTETQSPREPPEQVIHNPHVTQRLACLSTVERGSIKELNAFHSLKSKREKKGWGTIMNAWREAHWSSLLYKYWMWVFVWLCVWLKSPEWSAYTEVAAENLMVFIWWWIDQFHSDGQKK